MSTVFDLLKDASGCIASGMTNFDKKRAQSMAGGAEPPAGNVMRITDWEQVRSNRIECEKIEYDGFSSIKVETEGTVTLQSNFIGYNEGGSIVLDLYWYNSGQIIEITDTSIVSWNLWLKANDGSDLTPSDVTSCICTFDPEQY